MPQAVDVFLRTVDAFSQVSDLIDFLAVRGKQISDLRSLASLKLVQESLVGEHAFFYTQFIPVDILRFVDSLENGLQVQNFKRDPLLQRRVWVLNAS